MRLREVLVAGVVVLAGTPIVITQTVYKAADPGVTAPRLVKEVKPVYTAQAMRARVEGSVKLSCVVATDGTAQDVRVLEGLHPQLDQQAIDAVKGWQFKPGARDGVAVPVLVEIEMTFALRNAPRDRFRLDAAGVFKKGDEGVVLPVVLSDVKPAYTADAMREKVAGTVIIDCVVLPDGTVGEMRVSRSLDPGLDGEATKALRKWRFKPGTKGDAPVPVQVQIEMTFHVK